MTHLQQGWQFWVDFEGFEPDDRLLPFGSCNLCANGERYISQSQKPQIAQAATMFLQEKRRGLLLGIDWDNLSKSGQTQDQDKVVAAPNAG